MSIGDYQVGSQGQEEAPGTEDAGHLEDRMFCRHEDVPGSGWEVVADGWVSFPD